MNKKSKVNLSPWIAWSIVVLVVGIVAFCVWYNYDQIDTICNYAMNTTTTKKTSTADWKTYTNDTYKFSFKYPTNWEAKEVSSGGVYQLVVGYRPVTMESDYSGSISVSKEKLTEAITRETKDDRTFNGQTTATLAGLTATKLSFTNASDTSIKPVIYLIEKGDNLFQITGEGNYPDSYKDKTIDSTIKTIISTFQFTK